jgi:peptide-methionine (S)-S-oxide reductase
VTFDPIVIQLKTLIDVFWAVHDPTTLNKQGVDLGTDYRSIILYSSGDQKRIIADSMLYTAKELWSAPLTTEVKPLETFYLAEPEHQNYAEANPASGYCRVVINPKLAKFKKQFVSLLA